MLTVELQSAVWWSKHTVANLTLNPPVTITPEVTCSEAVEILQRCVHVVRSCAFSSFTRWYSEGFDQVPVVDDTSKILGMLTEGALMKKLLSGAVLPGDSVSRALYREFRKVPLSMPLATLSRILDQQHFAVVVHSQLSCALAERVRECLCQVTYWLCARAFCRRQVGGDHGKDHHLWCGHSH